MAKKKSPKTRYGYLLACPRCGGCSWSYTILCDDGHCSSTPCWPKGWPNSSNILPLVVEGKAYLADFRKTERFARWDTCHQCGLEVF